MADNSTLLTRIVLRNDTSVNWSTLNPIPLKGEMCVEIDSGKFKFGDGMHAYNELEYGKGDEIDASELPIGKDLVFTTAFGKYQPDSSGSVTVPCKNWSFVELMQNAFSEEKQPSVTQPSISISCPQAKAYEVGTKVTPSYSTSFNKGKYQYGPDTAVTVASYAVSDGTNSLETASGSFPEITVADAINYKITVTAQHTAGAQPLTNLGNPASVQAIQAGSKSASSGAITGFRAMFAGSSTSAVELNSANIRGLEHNVGAPKNYDLNIIEGARQVIIALPEAKTLKAVKDVNAFGTDIVASFVKSSIAVEGVDGYTAANYNVYVYAPSTALGANTYNVEIA
mgnify:CR=1 FL=1